MLLMSLTRTNSAELGVVLSFRRQILRLMVVAAFGHIIKLLLEAVTGLANEGPNQRFKLFCLWDVGHTRYLPMHKDRLLWPLGINGQQFFLSRRFEFDRGVFTYRQTWLDTVVLF